MMMMMEESLLNRCVQYFVVNNCFKPIKTMMRIKRYCPSRLDEFKCLVERIVVLSGNLNFIYSFNMSNRCSSSSPDLLPPLLSQHREKRLPDVQMDDNDDGDSRSSSSSSSPITKFKLPSRESNIPAKFRLKLDRKKLCKFVRVYKSKEALDLLIRTSELSENSIEIIVAESGDLELIKYLFNIPKFSFSFFRTSTKTMIRLGLKDLFIWLLDNQSVQYNDPEYEFLHNCARYNRLDMLKILEDRTYPIPYDSLAKEACLGGSKEVFEYVITKNPTIHHYGWEEWSEFARKAIEGGHPEFYYWLVEIKGAPIDQDMESSILVSKKYDKDNIERFFPKEYISFDWSSHHALEMVAMSNHFPSIKKVFHKPNVDRGYFILRLMRVCTTSVIWKVLKHLYFHLPNVLTLFHIIEYVCSDDDRYYLTDENNKIVIIRFMKTFFNIYDIERLYDDRGLPCLCDHRLIDYDTFSRKEEEEKRYFDDPSLRNRSINVLNDPMKEDNEQEEDDDSLEPMDIIGDGEEEDDDDDDEEEYQEINGDDDNDNDDDNGDSISLTDFGSHQGWYDNDDDEYNSQIVKMDMRVYEYYTTPEREKGESMIMAFRKVNGHCSCKAPTDDHMSKRVQFFAQVLESFYYPS